MICIFSCPIISKDGHSHILRSIISTICKIEKERVFTQSRFSWPDMEKLHVWEVTRQEDFTTIFHLKCESECVRSQVKMALGRPICETQTKFKHREFQISLRIFSKPNFEMMHAWMELQLDPSRDFIVALSLRFEVAVIEIRLILERSNHTWYKVPVRAPKRQIVLGKLETTFPALSIAGAPCLMILIL